MDSANLSANLPMVRDHLGLVVFLLFGVPAASFICMKFWTAARSARVQRSTNWFVPTDLESDAARMHYSMQHNSVAFAHNVHRNSRHAVEVRRSRARRSH